tara:strand:- start:494 stop:2059 length:1566 start_codon:yes stop_codon:yes gene_type:complete
VIVCGINIGHYSSLTLMKDGKIIYYNEETKVSQKKIMSGIPYYCIDQIKDYEIDHIWVTSYNWEKVELTNLKNYLFYKKILKEDKEIFCLWHPHHLAHLYKAYVDSGFKKARVFVIDGRGSNWVTGNNTGTGYETSSIYDIEGSKVSCVYKKIYSTINNNLIFDSKKLINNIGINKNTKFEVTNKVDLGLFYSHISTRFGYDQAEGKFMGLTSYGKINYNLLKELNKGFTEEEIMKLPVNVDASKTYQTYFENKYQELVKKFKAPNMIFTGGTALNVVNNYKLKKLFPKSKMYFEPLCGDEGNSIGAAYYHYLINNKKIKIDKNIFIGSEIKIDKNLLKNEYLKSNITIKDIVNILNKGEVIGLIKGKAEGGPRALGNRSLLLDPTIKNAKDIMNEIKKREHFRPFACSILEKNFSEYFDVDKKEKSLFMMTAPQAKKKAMLTVPSIVHVDGTCRVQTVSKNNKQLYKILKEFKVPVIMNTSFNLAGYPMVEKFKDVLFTLRNSKLKYVYFSDENKLIIKK